MKKLIATITVFVYLAFSCGVMVNMHYCMNRLQSVDLYASQKNECSNCGMPITKKHNCCRDEVKIVKLQNDQNKSQVSFSIKPNVATIITSSEFVILPVSNFKGISRAEDHIPPLLSKQGTYLQNCVFRI